LIAGKILLTFSTFKADIKVIAFYCKY